MLVSTKITLCKLRISYNQSKYHHQLLLLNLQIKINGDFYKLHDVNSEKLRHIKIEINKK